MLDSPASEVSSPCFVSGSPESSFSFYCTPDWRVLLYYISCGTAGATLRLRTLWQSLPVSRPHVQCAPLGRPSWNTNEGAHVGDQAQSDPGPEMSHQAGHGQDSTALAAASWALIFGHCTDETPAWHQVGPARSLFFPVLNQPNEVP